MGLGDGFTIFGIAWETLNGRSRVEIEENVFTNTFFNIFTLEAGQSSSKFKIEENVASGVGVFYTAATIDFLGSPDNINSEVDICRNNFTGGAFGGAILVLTALDGSNTPWNNLIINIEKNCFDGRNYGFGPGLFGLAAINGSTGTAGTISINAHYNNIVGYTSDIVDINTNANFDVRKNWWGQSSGVGVIVFVGTYTGDLDTGHPLRHEVRCFNEEQGSSSSSSSSGSNSHGRHHARAINIGGSDVVASSDIIDNTVFTGVNDVTIMPSNKVNGISVFGGKSGNNTKGKFANVTIQTTLTDPNFIKTIGLMTVALKKFNISNPTNDIQLIPNKIQTLPDQIAKQRSKFIPKN
jgi:hypothetical protein